MWPPSSAALQHRPGQPVDLHDEQAAPVRPPAAGPVGTAHQTIEPALEKPRRGRPERIRAHMYYRFAHGPPPIVAAVRRFVDDEVRPVAAALEHADAYPHALVARMRALGLFGALVPAGVRRPRPRRHHLRAGHRGALPRLDVAGRCHQQPHHGRADRAAPRHRRAARAASCRASPAAQARGGLCLTEPHAGSDVQAIRTVARARRRPLPSSTGTQDVRHQRPRGQRLRAPRPHRSRAPQPRHRGMSCFIVEKGHPGFRVVKSIAKLGYKGVDTAELVFEDFPVPGRQPGRRRRGPRLRARDVRARGRTHQHRRARGGRRPGRLRATRCAPRARGRSRRRRRSADIADAAWRPPGSSPTGRPA